MWRLKLYRGIWCAVRRDGGKTVRYSLRTRDRGEAERRLKDGIDPKPSSPNDLISGVMETYLSEKQDARSYQSMLTAWRALQGHFAHLRPDQITRNTCRSYASLRRKQGVKDGTIIKDLGVLRAAVAFSKRPGAIFELPHAPPPRDRHLTREEVGRLIESADLPHVRLFIILAWATAGRASAILELTWDRVDWERGIVRLSKAEGRRKGRASVPIAETWLEALRESYEARTCEYVIEWGGKPVKSVRKGFDASARRAGIKDCSPHVLRHSAAVRMVESGMRIEEVAQFLGHVDPRVTYRVYGRFSPEHLKKGAEALR